LKNRILFITTVYRTGEKVYPIINPLSLEYDVDLLNLFQMSNKTPWIGEIDPRLSFYKSVVNKCQRVLHGPKFERDKNAENYEPFMRRLGDLFDKNTLPNLVIVDNNITIRGGYTSDIYKWFNSRGIPVISCPHGNKDYKGYRVLKHIGTQYDYSFVFGKKDRDGLCKADSKRAKHKKRLLLGGIPSNDRLKDYTRCKKHILVIPNYTDPQFIKRQVKGYRPFTKQVFDNLNIRRLADKYGCGILVKEKNKQDERSLLLRESLSSYDGITFMKDCLDDNKLVAESACVITALSTMAFKPIQLGVPTAVLHRHGALGNFADFPGLINENDGKALRKTLDYQEKNGRYDGFVEDALEGGCDFTSIDKYVSRIKQVLGEN